jgi:secreted protein with Ig-like and vWFA domain
VSGYIGGVFYKFVVVVDLDAVGELDGKEDGVLDLVTYIGSSDVIVEALGIVLYDYLTLALALVLPLYELFLDVIVSEGLDKGTEFLLLVVTG